MPGLKITFSLADQSFTKTKSIGIFNLSLGLVRALQDRSEIERLDILANSSLAHLVKPARNTRIWIHETGLSGPAGRILWDQWSAYSQARRLGNEWLFLPKGFASFIRPAPGRMAAGVADTIHDFYRRRHPDAVSSFEDRYFDYGLRATLEQSAAIFTISDFTRTEVVRAAHRAGIRPPRVIHSGIGFDDPGESVADDKSGLVVLAGRFPHKLTGQTMTWLDRWQREAGFTETVDWVGSFPAGMTCPRHPNWRPNQRLSETEYRTKLAAARVLIFASEYEGFGMPPVEATLAGTCPVYSRIPATVEVMGTAGRGFDNDQYESFAQALESALRTPPALVEQWKRELLGRHSWKRVADRIVSALLTA